MSVLENLLSQATNPLNTTYNSDTLKVITELINRDPNDGVSALRLLAHKIQSPQDREALNSLKVLEWLANNCGKTFVAELGKFKFLNEIIKVLSPKYLGEQTSPTVKDKCVQLLYQWQRDFSDQEPKFTEAYKMLRQQGVIKNDPAIDTGNCPITNHRENTQRSIFERNQQSARLTELLRSRNPAEVAEANRIIKTIVEEDEKRLEQVTQRSTEMEALKNNSLLLGELMNTFINGSSSHSEIDLMEELAQNIRNSRPNLYSIPLTHQEQDMETMTEIARICDQASTILANYEEKVRSNCLIQLPSAAEETEAQQQHNGSDTPAGNCNLELLLSDKLGDISLAAPNKDSSPVGDLLIPSTISIKSVDDLADIFSQITSINQGLQTSQPCNSLIDTAIPNSSGLLSNATTSRYQAFRQSFDNPRPQVMKAKPPSDPFNDLGSICRQMMALPNQSDTPPVPVSSSVSDDHHEEPLLLLSPADIPSTVTSEPPPASRSPLADPVQSAHVDWNSLQVSLSNIKPHPGNPSALRLFPRDGDETGVQLDLHYAANRPLPDVVVFVAVTTNRAAVAANDLQVRFATNKPFQLRQLPASGSQLPAYSQFLPVGAVSQVVLLRIPAQEDKFLLKFQLSFCLEGGDTVLEAGHQELSIGPDGRTEMHTG